MGWGVTGKSDNHRIIGDVFKFNYRGSPLSPYIVCVNSSSDLSLNYNKIKYNSFTIISMTYKSPYISEDELKYFIILLYKVQHISL